MTRFEIIQRFANDERTHRDHLVTFQVLAEIWVNEGKPESFAPDLNEVIRFLKARPSSVYRWLSELDKYGFIEYRRGRNQHEVSTVVFKVAGIPNETAQPQMRQQTIVAGIPNETATTEMRQRTVVAGIPDETAASQMREQTDNVPVSQMRQQHPKRDSTFPNETAESAIIASEGNNVDNSGTAQPLLVHNNNHLIKELIIISKGDKEGDYDVKGVQGKKQTNRKLTKTAGCKFTDSPLADLDTFREAFASDRTARAADLDHYHARLLNWRDKKGNVPERTDWLATAKTFLLNDYREGKLVTVTTNVKPLHNANSRNHSGRAVIEPESTPGRRFGTW